MTDTAPWSFLDTYRGTQFEGEWPTLPEMFRINVGRFPDNNCFTEYNPERVSLTYRQALEKVESVSGYLRSLGIGPGTNVALTGKNSPEWAVAYLAILDAGATVVPIDYQIGIEESKNLLRASDAVLLFVDEEKAKDLEGASPAVKKLLSLYRGGKDYLYDLAPPQGFDRAADAASRRRTRSEDVAAILFTSGTTGTPKGVMLTHRNLVADCYLAQANLTVHSTDVFYALLPIHHSYTMLAVFIEAISTGAEIVFGKRMIVKQILKDLKDAKVTMFLGVPLLFNKLLNGIIKGVKDKGPVAWTLISTLMAVSGFIKKVFKVNPGKKIFHSVLEKASLSTIRNCISGGGPLAPSVFRRYNQLGLDFVQGYGLTETSPIIALNPVGHYKETSVGKIIPGVEMKILDPDQEGIGEIAVKGPMVMKGYYKMPEETKEVFTADGWLKTGDLGYLDSENYVYLTGRAKNLIVTEGGKNVYPEEIENRFQLYMEIEQILVRGYCEGQGSVSELIEALVYPDQEWLRKFDTDGKRAKAAAKDRIQVMVDEVNQKLLPYQKITRLSLLDEPMEMTTTKKVKRFSAGK